MLPSDQLGPIDPACLYPLPVFQRLTGWDDKAIQAAVEVGLIVLHVNGLDFVMGQDAIRYIRDEDPRRPDRVPTDADLASWTPW